VHLVTLAIPYRQILTMGLVLAWYIFLNLSTALRLSENRLMVLIRAIISDRSNKAGLVLALNNTMVVKFNRMTCLLETLLAYIKYTYLRLLSSYENKIFNAVPRPVVWILPHSLHFSQPTQSMILVTFRKCSLNSSLSTYVQ
jgi:hypothetical protein